jgi:hypothetical protein
VWLWERYLPGLKVAIRAKGWPTHLMNPEFAPERLYYWVQTLFADYRKPHPNPDAGASFVPAYLHEKC